MSAFGFFVILLPVIRRFRLFPPNDLFIVAPVMLLCVLSSIVGFVYLVRAQDKSLGEKIGNTFNILWIAFCLFVLWAALNFPHQTLT